MNVFRINDYLIAALCVEDAKDLYDRKIGLPVQAIHCMEMTERFRRYIEEYEYWRKCGLHGRCAGFPFFINLD
jgi:hypothetical protein